MIRRLDTHAEDTPLTIEDLVNECENYTALKMDNTDMEGARDIHAVWEKKIKCFNCAGPHKRSECPRLLSAKRKKRKEAVTQTHGYQKKRCKKVVAFSAENARTYFDVTIQGCPIGSNLTLVLI